MSACSSAELEPGPITPLDESIVDETPSPPVFAPLAQEFSSSLPGLYSTFDDSIATLAGESTLDVVSGVLDALGAAPTPGAGGVNAEALANLQAAEDGFRVARDKTASLLANTPADVQQPATFILTYLIVQDAAGARVAGARVTIDADFGNGTTRVSDGNGLVNFGLPESGVIAWTVDAAGYARGSGTITLAGQLAYTLAIGPRVS